MSSITWYCVSSIETDETEPVSVMEGDSVTLHTDLSEILNDDTILWMFGPKHALISQIRRKEDLTSFSFTGVDVGFRGRLQVDENTGSLTIRNTRITHSGQYKLSISREKTTTKIFSVTVSDTVGETDAVKSVSVTQGESVTLNTDAEIHKYAMMLWRFGDKGVILAKIDIETNTISFDERFRDRLKLDNQTGSLTINNTRITDSGLYELQIRDCESSQRFLLSVTDPGLSSGAIAGISIGVLVPVLLLVAAAFGLIYYRHRISKSKRPTAGTREKTATEGESFITRTEMQGFDTIEWDYKAADDLIAEINRGTRRLLAVGSLSVKEGGPALLKTRSTEIQTGDLILWTFGPENGLVVKADSRLTNITERFEDRLKLDKMTGSLFISNISLADSGPYNLQIINKEHTTYIRINVKVTHSSGDRVNEPVTEESPLLNGDVPDGEDEQQSSV